MLVELGADVNARIQDGSTPLHMAAGEGHLECVQALVEMMGADVLALDSNGMSALKLASLQRHNHVVKCLASYVAASSLLNKNIPDGDDEEGPSLEAVGAYQSDEPRNPRRKSRVCAVCTATQSHVGGKLLKCAGCNQVVRYCSTVCQKRHWRSHHKEEARLAHTHRNSSHPLTPMFRDGTPSKDSRD